MNLLLKTLRNKSFWALALAGIIVLTTSCDVVKSDVKKDVKLGQVDAYKVEGEEFAINLDAAFPNSRYVGVASNSSIDLSVEEANGQLLVYKPKDGIDEEFKIELESISGGTEFASVEFQNRSLAPCGNAENFTEATISNDSKLVIDLLENEDFCGLTWINNGGLVDPKILSGNYKVEDANDIHLHVGKGKKNGFLTYTFIPKKGFTGVVELEYWAVINFDNEVADSLSNIGESIVKAIYEDGHTEWAEYVTRDTARITITN